MDLSQFVENKYNEAFRKISELRCNSYLDLRGEEIPLQLWREMEEMIVQNLLLVPVRYIDIRGSSIELKDVRPDLQGRIVGE